MSDEPEASNEARWLEPPEPGEARIHIAVDEAAELTPQVRQALDALARALETEEVQGSARPSARPGTRCPTESICAPQSCKPRALCASRGTCTEHTCNTFITSVR